MIATADCPDPDLPLVKHTTLELPMNIHIVPEFQINIFSNVDMQIMPQ